MQALHTDFSIQVNLSVAAVVSELQRAGIVLLATATHSREARLVVEAGVDTILAYAFEGGGGVPFSYS